MDFLSRIVKGLVVGVANIIPGVSGGTMAVVMGIYDKLIGARILKIRCSTCFQLELVQFWELCFSAI